MLKVNSKKTLDIIIAQKKKNGTAAYKQTHPKASDNAARNNVSKLLRNPEAQLYLEAHRDLAQTTQIDILNNARKRKESVSWQTLASTTAERILDRTDGKPLTKTHNINLSVSIEEALNSLE